MNPPGMFLGGKRRKDYSTTSDLLPSSGKLIPEFFGRRNIRDMFARKPSLQQFQSHAISSKYTEVPSVTAVDQGSSTTGVSSPISEVAEESCDSTITVPTRSPPAVGKKRSAPVTTCVKSKRRGQSGSALGSPPVTGKGQQSLKGFFKPTCTLSNVASANQGREWSQTGMNDDMLGQAFGFSADLVKIRPAPDTSAETVCLDSAIQTPRRVDAQHILDKSTANHSPNRTHRAVIQRQEKVHDPVESKDSWSKLFRKPAAPRCEGHDESCISLLTKKPGMNLGRSFWMCPRPLGPSGAKEKNTQWRCQTFIWCSDWNPNVANG